MSLINFESSWKKAEEREKVREARQTILAAAEANAEKVAKRQEAENAWMLPGLEAQITGGKKKKSKKEKKEKKKKKQKKSKKKQKGNSSSSDTESETEWIEKEQKSAEDQPVKQTDRDAWMEFGAYVSDRSYDAKSLFREKDAKKSAREEEERIRQEKWKARELNPNLKSGATSSNSDKNVSSKIGDGGASWLRRAFKRAQEQAEREGKSIEEVAAVRWGSLSKFHKMLAEAEGSTPVDEPSGRSHQRSRRSRSRSRDRRRGKSRSRSRSRERSRRSRTRSRSRDKRRRSTSRERSRRLNEDRPSKKFSRPDIDDNHGNTHHSERVETKAGSGGWKKQSRIDEERAIESKKRPSPSHSTSSSSDEEATKKEEKQVEKAKILTEQELNALGAKLIKAELLGNEDLAKRLKAQLEDARQARERHLQEKDAGGDEVVEEVVVLTRTDGKGLTRPVDATAESNRSGKKRKKKLVETHGKDRQRQRYFADDDKYDLKSMFEMEKLSTAEDQNTMLSRLAGRGMETTNQEYDMDDVIVSRAAASREGENEAARDRTRAIAEHKKMAKVLDTCKFCFGTKAHKKHLMIAIGRTCYLALPEHAPLSEGHCFIIPMSHVSCSLQLDEDVYTEIQEFRRALTKMFRSEDEDCVFFETAMNLRSHPHMVVECVPLPRELGDVAPMYFQKAIQECEMEWSHNKKLISLRDKPLRRSVPKGLPYFHVDFGLENGFAHVIEDEKDFPRHFAQEIVGGMLDLEPRLWRNPRPESFENQRKKVIGFGSRWQKFDFTKKNNGDSSSSEDD